MSLVHPPSNVANVAALIDILTGDDLHGRLLFLRPFWLEFALLGEGPPDIIALLELALFVAADVTLVALVRLNQFTRR